MSTYSIEHLVYIYTKTILNFEFSLKAIFKLTEHPWRCQSQFPRHGSLIYSDKIYKYRFHGAGCSIEIDELELHYDYLITSEDYLITNPWKFWKFAATFQSKMNEKVSTESEIEKALTILYDKNVLIKPEQEYNQYQIRFEWMKLFSEAS